MHAHALIHLQRLSLMQIKEISQENEINKLHQYCVRYCINRLILCKNRYIK